MSLLSRFWKFGDADATQPSDIEPAWLVVGLGNPGRKYEQTPHNLGFLVVDRLAERNQIRVSRPESGALVGLGRLGSVDVAVAKPQSFMNRSGGPVSELMMRYQLPPDRMLLVYDELALPWGQLRVRPKGSSGGHNGVTSVIDKLGTQDFPRLRLGVQPGHPVADGARYLLSGFSREQGRQVDELLDRGAEVVESIITEGVEKAMAMHNRRARGKEEEE